MPLTAAPSLQSLRLQAGEAFVVQMKVDDGLDADSREFVMSLYGEGRTVQHAINGEQNGDLFEFIRDGSWTENLYGKSGLKIEIAERMKSGRAVIATPTFTVDASAGMVEDFSNGVITRSAVFINASFLTNGVVKVKAEPILYEPAMSVPDPEFLEQPTVTPATGHVGDTFTATPGSATVAVDRREWRAGNAVVGTGLTVVSTVEGALTYQEFAGSASSVVQTVTVSAAPIPDPSFTQQPTVSPSSGTAGQTFTVTPGTVANGSVTSRVWKLDGTPISTSLSSTPSAAGTLTYQEFAGAVGSTIRTVTVSAVQVPDPSFTAQPTVSPTSGTAGQTFTATAGTVANGSVTSRAWKLDGTTISTNLTATPSAAGTLTYQEFAGPTGSTIRTIAVAAVPMPTFTAQPTVTPSSGTAGQTFTATPGTVANGSITSRAWKLDGTTISTVLTATPSGAGTLTYQEFADAAASVVRTVTVGNAPAPTFGSTSASWGSTTTTFGATA